MDDAVAIDKDETGTVWRGNRGTHGAIIAPALGWLNGGFCAGVYAFCPRNYCG